VHAEPLWQLVAVQIRLGTHVWVRYGLHHAAAFDLSEATSLPIKFSKLNLTPFSVFKV
jgi:L-alanine-DL-glutamate epimerase-like enolase superfamily enzyme